jgi:hypothetical protein
VRNLSRGLRCAADSARTRAGGVEASSSGKHVGQVATLHHRQLAVHIGEAGVTQVPGVGKGGVGGFAEELHCAGANVPQSLEGDGAERLSRAGVVSVVVLTLVCAPESSRMASGASGGAKVGVGEGMDERDVAGASM